MKVEEVIALYKLYGFDVEEKAEEKGYIIFGYEAGFFYNIEIVKLNQKSETDRNVQEVERNYRQQDFDRINIEYFSNIKEVQEFLFKSFFKPDINKKKLEKEYETYISNQNEKLQSTYRYIEGNFQNSEAIVEKGLVNYIAENSWKKQGELLILEAAAGYGKTCTVYEILHQLLQNDGMRFPLFIELSKNRNARLFRYVLQDEINKKFQHISYNLVIEEIKQGNLPLIIDGFDELIEQDGKVRDDSDERSLSMLTTIVDLLGEDSSAWILLTTRNSAIFSGDLFEQWVLNKIGKNCEVERIRILKPSVKDWLGQDLYDQFKRTGVDIENIANPVLLTFIKNNSDTNQVGKICDMDTALQQYFNLLLSRDRKRQGLKLNEKEQYSILKKLAASFAEYDIISEDIYFIQDLLHEILDDNMLELLEQYKEDTEEGLTIQTGQELIQRLSHSCLLDRLYVEKNEYGFINEFILGILAGEAIVEEILEPNNLSEAYLNIVVSSFENRNRDIRIKLYDKIENILRNVSDECRLNAQNILLQNIVGQFNEQYIQSISFSENVEMMKTKRFINCIFDGCVFSGCSINPNIFLQCKFYNCKFYNLKIQDKVNSELLFMNCEGEEVFQCKKEIDQKDVDKYEKLVLEQFWKPGYQTAELRRTYTALFKGIDPKEHGHIQEAVQRLLKEKIIRQLNICYEMNVSKLKEIKIILGR